MLHIASAMTLCRTRYKHHPEKTHGNYTVDRLARDSKSRLQDCDDQKRYARCRG